MPRTEGLPQSKFFTQPAAGDVTLAQQKLSPQVLGFFSPAYVMRPHPATLPTAAELAQASLWMVSGTMAVRAPAVLEPPPAQVEVLHTALGAMGASGD